MAINLTLLESKIDQAVELDKAKGRNAHDKAPPLDEGIVTQWESDHGFTMPADFRQCITQISAHGVGFVSMTDATEVGYGFELANLAQPFPYQEPEVPPPFEEDESWSDEEWETHNEAYWDKNFPIITGAIPLCEQGCGMVDWLVVVGEFAGTVWRDDRAVGAGSFALTHRSFGEWYIEELDKDIAYLSRVVGEQ